MFATAERTFTSGERVFTSGERTFTTAKHKTDIACEEIKITVVMKSR